MGGSISKSTIKGNKSTLDKLDLALSDILTTTLQKYSEMVEANVSAQHQAHIETFKKRGATLAPIPAPKVSIQDTFKAKCTKDVVMIIKNKLQRFPKWALVERGFLFSSKKPIPYEIQDPSNLNKDQLCQKMAELYTALLLSIELAVTSLFTCRKSLDDLSARLDTSFVTKNKETRDAIHDTPANAQWFTSMNDLQKMYDKNARAAKKLFNSLNGVSVLSTGEVDKFKSQLAALNNQMQALPNQCSLLFDQLDRIPTIGKAIAEECVELKIDPKQCNKDFVNVKRQQQEAAKKLEEAQMKALAPK